MKDSFTTIIFKLNETGKYGIKYSYLLEILREQVGWFVTAWNPRLYRSHFVE